jgi:hypothetical protein
VYTVPSEVTTSTEEALMPRCAPVPNCDPAAERNPRVVLKQPPDHHAGRVLNDVDGGVAEVLAQDLGLGLDPERVPVFELDVAEAGAEALCVAPRRRPLGQEVDQEHLEAEIVTGEQIVDVDVPACERVTIDVGVETVGPVAGSRA